MFLIQFKEFGITPIEATEWEASERRLQKAIRARQRATIGALWLYLLKMEDVVLLDGACPLIKRRILKQLRKLEWFATLSHYIKVSKQQLI